ncbi:hypothetical protein MAPG_02207 [Magnaporthiopsis poae ATCC 64411]|uniref:Yeast cell wall synthesis Kre9/Knh1-like N-terminal domain-containing protein n=1 Tax=Magnaporthiopsis poae (strain ATCC 64411 / 73-15) TaxID=644358 RepID=A0A0C4DQR1_MAGP6|nr:hypothetical protein MAPG_02207 [Magnaporthiopsis poae ATCC 64411]
MRSSWNFLPSCLLKALVLALLCLLLPLCRAGPTFTNTHYDIVPGVPFELSWAGNESPVTVELVSVANKSIEVVQNVTVNDSRGSVTWTPPESVPPGVHLLFRIRDSGGKLDYSRDLDFKKGTSLSSTLVTDPAPSPTVDPLHLPTTRKTSMPTPAAEKGLSTGEKVGIGIGVAAVPLLLLVAFLVFLSWRRRRRQQRRRRGQEEQEARVSHHQHHYHLDPAAVRASKAGSIRTTSSYAATDIASDCSCCSAAAASAPGPAPPPPLTTRMPWPRWRQCSALAELETRANVAQVESTERPWSRRGEAWRRQQAVESPVLGRARLDTPSLYSQDGPGI